MKIKRGVYYEQQKYPHLRIEFEEPDLPDAVITPDAFRWIYHRKRDIVALGHLWTDLTSVTVDGRTFRGLTDDPAVVAMVKRYLLDISEGGAFEPGTVLEPQPFKRDEVAR